MRHDLFFLALLIASPAFADGGHIALHATSGSTTITLFTAPEPLIPGPADLSALVQDAAADQPLSNVQVRGTLTGQHGRIPLIFTQGGTLMTVTVHLPAPGTYRLDLAVDRSHAPAATFSTMLVVEANQERRTTVILALLFPLATIALFLVNQQLKANRRASR